MSKRDDDFSKSIIGSIQKRAAFICSNPDCRCITIAPSNKDEESFIYIGIVAHIKAVNREKSLMYGPKGQNIIAQPIGLGELINLRLIAL